MKDTIPKPGIDGRYHYVYQIDRIGGDDCDPRTQYIGARISKIPGHKDPYMGSSQSLNEHMKSIGPIWFRKTILSYHNTWKEARKREIKLLREKDENGISYFEQPWIYNLSDGKGTMSLDVCSKGGMIGGMIGGKRVHELHPDLARKWGQTTQKRYPGLSSLTMKRTHERYPDMASLTMKRTHERYPDMASETGKKSGKIGGKRTHELHPDQSSKNGRKTSSMCYKCNECGMVSNPGAIGRHQKANPECKAAGYTNLEINMETDRLPSRDVHVSMGL